MSVLTIIGVPLDYAHSSARAALRNLSSSIEVGLGDGAFTPLLLSRGEASRHFHRENAFKIFL